MSKILKYYFGDKKIVVCYRNSGLGDLLLQASSGWLYAHKTSRSLMINWTNSIYLRNKSQNAFLTFFDIPDTILNVKIIKVNRLKMLDRIISIHIWHVLVFVWYDYIVKKIFGGHENIFYKYKNKLLKDLSNEETLLLEKNTDSSKKVVFLRSCLFNLSKDVKPFFDALKPNPELSNEIENFSLKHFANKKVIGIHVRYYDKALIQSNHTPYWIDTEKGLKIIREKIMFAIEKAVGEDYVIYLTTDSLVPHEYLTHIFPDIVYYPKRFGQDISKELHQELPEETANATIIEMFLLAKSDILLRFPPNSWFSHYASLYVNTNIS